MHTLAIQYPDPWGKSAIPNKENSPPCPGWGEVGANIDRCNSVQPRALSGIFFSFIMATDTSGDGVTLTLEPNLLAPSNFKALLKESLKEIL